MKTIKKSLAVISAKIIKFAMNGKFRCVMQRSELKLHLNTRVQEDQPVKKTKPEAVKQKDLQLEQLARECRGGSRAAQKKLYDALAP
ncbi:MAG: hypothetical protein II151_04580, partial [Bacteroidales bacterium]|nr:hypothetical protein [Bacteroidales bacterium]